MKFLCKLLSILTVLLISLNISAKEENVETDEDKDNSIEMDRITNNDIEVVLPTFVFAFKEANITLKFKNPVYPKLLSNNNELHFIINGENIPLTFTNGVASFKHRFKTNDNSLSIYMEEFSYNKDVKVFPLWGLLLPIVLIIAFLARKKIGKKKKITSL